MSIVKVNAQEFGIEESKAKQIEAAFVPMLEKMTELEGEANAALSLALTPDHCEIAKKVRLKYVKVRKATEAIHKKEKAFYLSAGRFVDGWKNTQKFAAQGIEEKLKAREDHFKNIELERIAKLHQEREEQLLKYTDETGLDLGGMEPEVWDAYLSKKKKDHSDLIEAQKIVEEARVKKEKEDAEEKERLTLLAEEESKKRIKAEKELKAAQEKNADELKKKNEEEQASKNKENTAKVHREISFDLIGHSGITEKQSKLILSAIYNGKINKLSIRYS